MNWNKYHQYHSYLCMKMMTWFMISFILINKIIDTYALRELNRPRFCRNSITFANQSIIGTYPYGIFMNSKNSIDVSDRQHDQILIWEKNINPSRVMYGSLSTPSCLFVMSLNASCCGIFIVQ